MGTELFISVPFSDSTRLVGQQGSAFTLYKMLHCSYLEWFLLGMQPNLHYRNEKAKMEL